MFNGREVKEVRNMDWDELADRIREKIEYVQAQQIHSRKKEYWRGYMDGFRDVYGLFLDALMDHAKKLRVIVDSMREELRRLRGG